MKWDRWTIRAALLVSLLHWGEAFAAGPPGAPPATTYPLTARIRAPRPLALGPEALEAFQQVVRKMFRVPADGAPSDLVLELSIEKGDVQSAQLELPIAIVFATVTVSPPDGASLASLRPQGSSKVLVRDEIGVRESLSRALRDCAQDLPRVFADSEPVVRWLKEKKLMPVGSFITGPARGWLVGFVDAGLGAVNSADGLGHGFTVKAGVSWPWLLVQGVFQSWNTPWDHGSGIDAVALGLELGPVVRIGRGLELRAGVGLHHVFGTLDTSKGYFNGVKHVDSADFTRNLPALHAGIQYSWWPGWSGASRIRFGVELRRYFDYDLPVDAIREVVPLADTYVGFYVGLEFPLIAARPQPLIGP